MSQLATSFRLASAAINGAALLLGWSALARAAEPTNVPPKKRTPWTTSTIQGSPEPRLPFVSERAFPNLKFDRCVDIALAPASKRFFIVEISGKVFSFPDQQKVKTADLAIDLKKAVKGLRNVYAITLHPDFHKNGYLYVCYVKEANLPDGTHVSRFTVLKTDPPTIDAKSEKTIVQWFSGGHNGCCLKFGNDGFLYISTGDGGPANPPDKQRAGQDISNLLSCILRIDVDQTENNRNYRIPSDNPFVETVGARGEIWAYGFRNPWRMSFDRKTGDLWVGDVGWELWEMLDRVQRGGNYGWAVTEGGHSTHPEWKRGPTPLLQPTISHPHSESSSITDGLTYYGSRLKGLRGAHIYGDYDTGKFWSFRYEKGEIVDHREIADTDLRIVGFGEASDGDFFILDHPAGTLHRLVPNPVREQQHDFPRKLSETGLFSTMKEATPAAGVIPYSINAEPWSDFASAERLVAVPDDQSIDAAGATYSFPKDSVLVKTLLLEMERGNPNTQRRIETQILHFDGRDWRPYSYRWNDQRTDARLLDAQGEEQVFEIVDADAPTGVRRQTWRFAGRAECQRCHNKWSGPPLAFNTHQLEGKHKFGGRQVSQIDAFDAIGLLTNSLAPDKRTQLANPHSKSVDISSRARAYLHTNCAHCHRLHAGGAVLSHMHYDLPLEKTNMISARPSQGAFGIHAAQVIAPGDPFRSILFYRMSKLGGGRMPHIGSSEIDREGLELIFQWIKQLGQSTGDENAADVTASMLRATEKARLTEMLNAEQSSVTPKKSIVSLLSSTSGAMVLLRAIDNGELTKKSVDAAIQIATTHEDVQVRDLFERFLPPAARIKRLGTAVSPDRILAIQGDASRGEQVFFNTSGVSCQNCHQVDKRGKKVGPELTQIGKRYSRAQLLESILEPSKRVDPAFVTYLVETIDGRLISGLLIERNDKEVLLRLAQNKSIRIPADKIEALLPQRNSLMPELLVRDLTAQQLADLIAYLSQLK